MSNVNVQATIDMVATGHADELLTDLFMAIVGRQEQLNQTMTWRLTIDDATCTEHDLTIDEWELVERIAGVSWTRLDPRARSRHAKAVVVAVLVHHGHSEEDAIERAGRMGGAAFLDALTWTAVPRLPLSPGR